MQALAERFRPAAALLGWGLLWAALGVAVWEVLASIAFLTIEDKWAVVSAWQRPVAWYWYASTYKGNLLELADLALAAVVALAPFVALGKVWFKHVGGARGAAQRVLGIYLIHRVAGHNFGAADFMPMREVAKLLPETPDPEIGGIVLGERVRMDTTKVAHLRFDPRWPEGEHTWGPGGKAPLMFDHCREGSTHGLLVVDSGGFKTMQTITTLDHWKKGAFIFDPSCEIAPMTAEWRREMGQRVRVLDPRGESGTNVVKWLVRAVEEGDALAEVALVVTAERTYGKTQAKQGDEGSAAYFREQGRNLWTAILGHVLWNSALARAERNLRRARRYLTLPEQDLRDFLRHVYETSECSFARAMAGPLYDLVKVTFDGIRGNAQQGTAWLSIEPFADMVSNDDFDLDEMCDGTSTIYCQIGMDAMEVMPEVGRAVVSAACNTIIRRDGDVDGRVFAFIDEADLMGPMGALKTIRARGRKYGVTLVLAYLSDGVIETVWGSTEKQAWFSAVTWRMYGTTQDDKQQESVSRQLGTYGARTVSTGQNKGTSGRLAELGSRSKGNSTNYGEMARRLMLPQEIAKMRTDERIIFYKGADPIRCRAPIAFCRPELRDRIGVTSFNKGIKARQRAAAAAAASS